MDIMEEQYKEFITKFPPDTKIININGNLEEFEAELRCQCKDKQEFISWLRQYEELSKITFRVASTQPTVGLSVLFKASYRCQHNTYPKSHQRVKSAHKKHTGCLAQLRVTIKASEIKKRASRSKDVLRFEYPTLVTVIHRHNHDILAEEALKHRSMSEGVKLKLIDMFKSHHRPSRALEILMEDLLEEYGDEYYKVSADTSICPTIQAVFRLYYSVFKKKFGEETYSVANYLVEILKRSDPQTKVIYELVNENDFVLAAVPPLMERVHDLSHSAETVFIDRGNMDRYNCKVFLLLTDSPVGGLPLGFLMTSLKTEEGIFKALTLLEEILHSKSFGGAGIKAPQVFVIDDCQAQINAITRVYPLSKIYLCTFHILQSLWRWLLESSNKIDVIDRQYLFTLFKNTVYSANEEQFQDNCNVLLQDLVANKYTNFVKHIKNIFQRAVMWAHCYRQNSRDINTNNTVENAMKIMKESFLNRTRAYNPIQLYEFIEIDLCNYYSRKIADYINGQYTSHQHLKQSKIEDLVVTLNDENGLYTVKNKTMNTEYTVNLLLGLCSCPFGKNGALCEHQHVVDLQLNEPCDNIKPITPKQRAYYHWIAFGTNVAEDSHDNLSSVISNEMDYSACENIKNEETSMESTEFLCEPINDELIAPNWTSLQQRFNHLIDTWKGGSNSLGYYKGLEKTVSFFENCNTEMAAISALHSVGKSFN